MRRTGSSMRRKTQKDPALSGPDDVYLTPHVLAAAHGAEICFFSCFFICGPAIIMTENSAISAEFSVTKKRMLGIRFFKVFQTITVLQRPFCVQPL